MTVALIQLVSGEKLISHVKEVWNKEETEFQFYVLDEPRQIVVQSHYKINSDECQSADIQLLTWPEFSAYNQIELHKHGVILITTPTQELIDFYDSTITRNKDSNISK